MNSKIVIQKLILSPLSREIRKLSTTSKTIMIQRFPGEAKRVGYLRERVPATFISRLSGFNVYVCQLPVNALYELP